MELRKPHFMQKMPGLHKHGPTKPNLATLSAPKVAGPKPKKTNNKQIDIAVFFKQYYEKAKKYYISCTQFQKYAWMAILAGILMIFIALILW